jgi:hypothetical protein
MVTPFFYDREYYRIQYLGHKVLSERPSGSVASNPFRSSSKNIHSVRGRFEKTSNTGRYHIRRNQRTSREIAPYTNRDVIEDAPVREAGHPEVTVTAAPSRA